MAVRKPAAATPALAVLEAAGVPFTVHPYEHDPRAASFGLEAAEALGLDPARVYKTLLVEADGALAVGIVPVAGSLDLKALGRALGARKVHMADVARAERETGYVAGGISPFGQKRPHETVVDETATAWETVFVSAGRRGLDVEVAPEDLLRLTRAVVAPIGR